MSDYSDHPAYNQVTMLVNDIRLNFDEGQGTLAEVANRIIHAVLHPHTEYESELDAWAAEIYNLKAQSPREMTPERWARIKKTFPGSARQCLEEAERQMEEDDD